MKGFMISMMAAMMPYMMYLVWIGEAAIVIGALAFAVRHFMKVDNAVLPRWILAAGRVAAGLGVFFLVCQVMGVMLGAMPGINFADSSKFEFYIVPFWQLGAVGLLAGIVLGYLSGLDAPEANADA